MHARDRAISAIMTRLITRDLHAFRMAVEERCRQLQTQRRHATRLLLLGLDVGDRWVGVAAASVSMIASTRGAGAMSGGATSSALSASIGSALVRPVATVERARFADEWPRLLAREEKRTLYGIGSAHDRPEDAQKPHEQQQRSHYNNPLIAGIVAGYPLAVIDNAPTPQCHKTVDFLMRNRAFHCPRSVVSSSSSNDVKPPPPILLMDERFTTQQAWKEVLHGGRGDGEGGSAMGSSSTRQLNRRRRVFAVEKDERAAVLILQTAVDAWRNAYNSEGD